MLALTPLARPADFLFWGARPADDADFTPEDPLALGYLSQQIGLWLFGSLTTRTGRAQYYPVVLYGLHLAERAVNEYSLSADDATRQKLFERWERFWAMAVLERRSGTLPRGDTDAMRGVRGAQRAWFQGDRALPLDFPLISRQAELGSLGAYLSSLRDYGLVTPGTYRVTPAAAEIVDAFWDEPGSGARVGAFDAFAMHAMDPNRTRVERKHTHVTLYTTGDRTRLSVLRERSRTVQQDRLWRALFEQARDRTTLPLAQLLQHAAQANATEPEKFIETALKGRLGGLSDELRDHFLLARAYGRLFRQILGRFNALYGAATRAGWIARRADIVRDVFDAKAMDALCEACAALLDAPMTTRLRSLPIHGNAFLNLVASLNRASGSDALTHLLAYHRSVQRERSSGDGWVRDEGDKVQVYLTTYGYDFEAPFPSLKIDVVRSLLWDLGRIQ